MGGGLDQVRWLPAMMVLVVCSAVSFLGLSALLAEDRPASEQPLAASSTPTVTQATQAVTVATRPTSTQVAAPAQAQQPVSDAEKEAMRQQASRSTSTPTTSAGSSLSRQVGQMIMTGYPGPYPSPQLLARIRKGQVGGVILMGENIGPNTRQAITDMQSAAQQAGRRLLVATDQEGGEVKRLASSAPSVSAAEMRSIGAARREGQRTASALLSLGINTDLAPVADVRHPGSFIGSRSFSNRPGAAAARACAFARGLQAAGAYATLKHFPGLGYAAKNTDVARVTISASAQQLQRDLSAYQRCPTDLVMMSNAVYAAYDPSAPAVFSSRIINDLLRGYLGYQGVVISDSLTATSVKSPSTAVRAVAAGVDMLLYIPADVSALAYRKVLAAVRRGEIPRQRVREASARIAALTR